MTLPILIVDDDRAIRQLLATALDRFGYASVSARHSAEAEQQLRRHACRGMLLDIDLPDEDGIAFARRLARTDLRLPVILMSGHDLTDAHPWGSVAAFLPKPFDLGLLIHAVGRMFGSAHASPAADRRPESLARRNPMTDNALIQDSFQRILPNGDRFIAAFYEHLFAANPELRPYFATISLDDQRNKLLMTLILIVENLDQPSYLGSVLQRLGTIHADHLVRPEQFALAGASLLACLARYLGDTWTPALQQAWASAYQSIVDGMLAGYEVMR